MSNPFNASKRTFGMQPRGASAGARGGLVPPPGAPPFYFDTLHWYDGTDPSVLFEDVAGLIPITDTAMIDRINNKGAKGIIPATDGAQNPVHRALDPQIGLPSMDNTPSLGFPIQWQGPEGIDAGIAGVSGFTTYRAESLVTQGLQGWGIAGNFINYNLNATPRWEMNFSGTLVNGGKAAVLNEWIWMLWHITAAGDTLVEVSGGTGATAGGNITPPVIPDGSNMTLHGLRGDMGEHIVWCREIEFPLEWNEVIAYADNKYGAMPIP